MSSIPFVYKVENDNEVDIQAVENAGQVIVYDVSNVNKVVHAMAVIATPLKLIFYQGNTQVISLLGLQDLISGNFLNAATLTATLYDDENNPIPECTGISLPYVTGSSGNYQGVFGDNNFLPSVGTGYTLIVTGSQVSPAVSIRLEIIVEVQARQN